MNYKYKIKRGLLLEVILFLFLLIIAVFQGQKNKLSESVSSQTVTESENTPIKWVDFNATYEALCRAYELDVETHQTEVHLDWISLLSYIACKNGGSFPANSVSQLNTLSDSLTSGETTMKKLTRDMKYYSYYLESYSAILGEFVGEYMDGDKEKYGLKAFSPIAGGFEYNGYDDFGSSRSYGGSRQHLGHDMLGRIGTPIICVEGGYIEALGWNQYGGWRIGIRSFDKKRYYYYAHMRQNYPYAEGLKEGDIVKAGQVIGYMGHTGYSTTENVNNIEIVHLHFGIQLIFDESQKDSSNEIWIDCYALTRFLDHHRASVEKVGETREWKSLSELQTSH